MRLKKGFLNNTSSPRIQLPETVTAGNVHGIFLIFRTSSSNRKVSILVGICLLHKRPTSSAGGWQANDNYIDGYEGTGPCFPLSFPFIRVSWRIMFPLSDPVQLCLPDYPLNQTTPLVLGGLASFPNYFQILNELFCVSLWVSVCDSASLVILRCALLSARSVSCFCVPPGVVIRNRPS